MPEVGDARRIQADVLLRIKRTLETIDAKVTDRLEVLAKPALDVATPIPDYDALTAKEVLAALAELDDESRKAVLAYEKAHKKRATVLKAARRAA